MFGKKNKLTKRIKRRIRKTSAVVLLITSIVVAAIPVPEAAAEDGIEAYAVEETYDPAADSVTTVATRDWKDFPTVQSTDIIFRDKLFLFSYLNGSAVIVGYIYGSLDNNHLDLSQKLDAYVQYNPTKENSDTYVAATQLGEPLYYKEVYQVIKTTTTDTSGNTVESEDTILKGIEKKGERETYSNSGDVYKYHLKPCLSTDEAWKDPAIQQTIQYYRLQNKTITAPNSEDFYYYKSSNGTTYNNITGDDQLKQLKGVSISYIASQRAEKNTTSGMWEVKNIDTTNPRGVFTDGTNINTISIPNTILGVGDYAFYGCTTLTGVAFDDALKYLGNSAFEGCTSLNTVTSLNGPDISQIGIEVIGKRAFYKSALTKFDFSVTTKMIGDEAFYGCRALKDVNFSKSKNLTKFGCDVFRGCVAIETVDLPEGFTDVGKGTFKGCSSLQKVIFPESYTKEIPISIFQGAFDGTKEERQLKSVTIKNATCKVGEVNTGTFSYGFADFIGQEDNKGNQISGDARLDFYFEGYGNSGLHEVTIEHGLAFKYMGSERYEQYITDENERKIGYEVDGTGALTNVMPDKNAPDGSLNMKIPPKIGGINVTTLSGDKVKDNKKIGSVTVPAKITYIGPDYFAGCENIKEVTFMDRKEAAAPLEIGDYAFDTQRGSSNQTPSLTFYGEISADSAEFQYAMDPDNKLNRNNSSQLKRGIYIDFCSGKPAWLYVQYNEDTGKAELHQRFDKTGGFKTNVQKEIDEIYKMNNNTYPSVPDISDNNVKISITKADDAIYYYNNAKTPKELPAGIYDTIYSAYNVTLPSGIQSIKQGIFSSADKDNTVGDSNGVSENAVGFPQADKDIRTIRMESIESLDDYTFYGCENLETVEMLSSGVLGGEEIGSYVFGKCENLTSVILPSTASSIGIRPFAGDTNIKELLFQSSEQTARNDAKQKYTSENGIIYEWDVMGAEYKRVAIMQCLPSRGINIGSPIVGKQSNDQMGTIERIETEAFMGCVGILTVDLSDTKLETIPKFCFADASKLITLNLPIPLSNSCELEEYALKDTNLKMLDVPSDNVGYNAGNSIFYSGKATDPDHILHDVIVVAPSEKGSAYRLADKNGKYRWSYQKSQPVFMITFLDSDGTEITKREVMKGEKVDLPTKEDIAQLDGKHLGKTFLGWSTKATGTPNVTAPFYASGNMTLWAYYADQVWNVWFVDNELNPVTDTPYMVEHGKSAKTLAPTNPKHSSGDPNYVFTNKWIPMSVDKTGAQISIDSITGEARFMADYRYQQPSSGGSSGGGTGGTGGGGSGTGGTGGTTGTTSDNNATQYTLHVVNGNGSGSYAAGTTVTVTAYYPNPGYQFASWTSSESDTNFTNKTVAVTTFKMPAKNLTVTANYISGSGGTSGNNTTLSRLTSSPVSNTGTVSSNTANNTAGTAAGGNTGTNGNNANGGSSVQINKPGISGAGAASATVNGATDNFVVKVTEDGQATAAIAEALRNEYGSLNDIRYFAMDISLYDESGTNKITNTSGLSVTITLPIPDELRQYGGNNRVGAVTNGNNLDKLDTRFTTINGTPCVTFTATHFSPYGIYVDTANLSRGSYDPTPKTGDAIHPKWFLAIGLALFSVVLFIKKDKKAYPEMA